MRFLFTLCLLFIAVACSQSDSSGTNAIFKRALHEQATDSSVMTNIGSGVCDTSSAKLDKLLEKDMSKEIDCLRSSIITFYDSVQTQNHNVVTKTELLLFLKKYSKGESIERGVDLLMMFNHLLRGDAPDRIRRENFLALLDGLKELNQQAIQIFPYISEVIGDRKALRFRDDKTKEKKISWDLFRLRRSKMQEASEKLSQVFEKLIIVSRPEMDSINLLELLLNLNRQDTLIATLRTYLENYSDGTIYELIETALSEKVDEMSVKRLVSKYALSRDLAIKLVPLIKDHIPDGNEDLMAQLKSLLFVKKIFTGGKSESLTHLEMNRVIQILPGIIQVVFDISNMPYIDFGNLENHFILLADDINFLKDEIFFSNTSEEKLITIDEIVNASDVLKFKFSDQKISDIKNTLKNVKSMLLGGSPYVITAKEMHDLTSKFKYAVKMVAFGYQMYESNKEIMEQPLALSPSQIQYLNQYPANNEDAAFKARFIRVVSTYRLFKGNLELPMYSDSIVRNADGVIEIMLYEYVVGFLLNYYNPNVESFENYYKLSINDQARVVDIINKIKDFLVLNDLYPRRVNHTADSLRMVTDLFQTTSDGKNGVGIAEGSELIGVLRDSSNIGKDLLKTMIDSKLCTADAKGAITVKCYRENFYQVFNRFYKYFPKFKSFVETNSKNDKDNVLQELLKRTEFFSRDCALDSRPIYKKDMSSIVAGLMDIESTIIHFDKNQNNILDYEELNDAFPVYKNAIIGVAKLKPSQEFLAKSIFLYLVKYQKIPSVGNLMIFFAKLETGWDKNISGDRVTIATLLKYISSMDAEDDPDCR